MNQSHLNEQELKDLMELQNTFDRLMDKYTGSGATYHSPHGVSEFCHRLYHSGFEPDLHKLEEGLLESDIATRAIQMENLVRQTFEAILLIGIEHGRTSNAPSECKCIENVADAIESELHQGNWGHA